MTRRLLLAVLVLAGCNDVATGPTPAARLEVVSGDQQLGSPGYLLADSLEVRLVTKDGAPVAGATVRWSATDRDAQIAPSTTVTDEQGIARAAWRLGRDDGTQHAVATYSDLESVRFESLAWTGDVLQAGGPPAYQCGAFRDEIVRCWAPPNDDPASAIAIDTDLRFVSLGFAVDRWCGSTRGGAIACILENELTPSGVFRPDAAPVHVVAEGVPLLTEVVGAGDPELGLTWCGVALDQRIWCWGLNASGQLGRGTIGGSGDPAPVGNDFRGAAVAVTTNAACALDTTGAAWCWGATSESVVAGSESASLPVAVPTPRRFFTIAADATGSVCAVSGDALVYCWGSNLNGGRGRNGLLPSPDPVAIEGTDFFVAITAGSDGFLGLTVDRFLVIWGGLSAASIDARPLRVLPGHVFSEVFSGGGRGAVCLRAFPSGTRCVDRVGLAQALSSAPALPVLYGIPSN